MISESQGCIKAVWEGKWVNVIFTKRGGLSRNIGIIPSEALVLVVSS
jgi:hypothetical protein